LSEQANTFLTQECDRMLDLYTQAQANAQSVFNFYMYVRDYARGWASRM